MVYRHGPARKHQFEWPGQNPGQVRIAMNPGSTSDAVVQRNFPGDWGLFRMLNAYGGVKGDGRDLSLEIMLGDYLARLHVEPASVRHPFTGGLIENFTLPPRL